MRSNAECRAIHVYVVCIERFLSGMQGCIGIPPAAPLHSLALVGARSAQVRRGDIGIEPTTDVMSNDDRVNTITQLFGSSDSAAVIGSDAADESLIMPIFTKVRQLGKIAVSLGQVISSYARV
jgi:hypothetical protein